AGLLGEELICQLLEQGKKVRAIYNKKDLPHHNLLERCACSILDVCGLEEAMLGINEVYHCAGFVSFSPGSEDDLYKINVEGTANVVNAAVNEGVKKMVHVSSVSALGRLRNNVMISEEMQWTEDTSNSKYGQSKYLGEMEVWRGIAEGLEAVIINPTLILGPGNWDEGSSGIFKSAYNEFPWYTDGISGFVDVRDVAAAMIVLMNSDVSGQRFIISAVNETYRNIFNNAAGCFNKKPPSKRVTPFLASLLWRFEHVKNIITHNKPLLTKETAATAFAKVYYNNKKFLDLFPSFTYRSLTDTISYTCNSLQQKLNNH
ncbi:MAG: NAD-dependent epimerase/dehydratase family protein, partial [Ferruginibacter sp.]